MTVLAVAGCKARFSGSGKGGVHVSDDGTVSVVDSTLGAAIRFHGKSIAGVQQDGWISFFLEGVSWNEEGQPIQAHAVPRGRVVAARGYFADESFLCQRMWLISADIDVTTSDNRMCGILSEEEPTMEACKPDESFVVTPVLIETEEQFLAKDVGEPDIFVEESCGDEG